MSHDPSPCRRVVRTGLLLEQLRAELAAARAKARRNLARAHAALRVAEARLAEAQIRTDGALHRSRALLARCEAMLSGSEVVYLAGPPRACEAKASLSDWSESLVHGDERADARAGLVGDGWSMEPQRRMDVHAAAESVHDLDVQWQPDETLERRFVTPDRQ